MVMGIGEAHTRLLTRSAGSRPVYEWVRATTSYPTADGGQFQPSLGAPLGLYAGGKGSRTRLHSSRKATVRCNSDLSFVQGTFRSWNMSAIGVEQSGEVRRRDAAGE